MYICEDIGSDKDDTKNDGLNHSSLPNPRPPSSTPPSSDETAKPIKIIIQISRQKAWRP